MTILGHEQLMLPLLRALRDGRERPAKDLARLMADHFNLSEEERQIKIKSGGYTYIESRTKWAVVDLVQARILVRPRRGWVKITERGRGLLGKNLNKLIEVHSWNTKSSEIF